APAAIRAALHRLTPDARNPAAAFAHLLERTVDRGDVAITGDVEADQQMLGEALAPLLADGVVPIVLGGGHETSFGHFLGYAGAGKRARILNWDAHPDVRPLPDERAHSGSPFRQALEHPSGACAGYTVAGLLPHSVSVAHLEWLREREGDWLWGSEITRERVDALYVLADAPLMASFDMDAVDAAWAPGVSAPAIGGMEPGLWLHAAYTAGRSPHVASLDLVETNPRHDPDGRTVRLAALTVWHFLRGLAERG
ncbi:MAG: formimidoylglutamase, partial [Gemmatimonadota bacterium]|nr:formimidoylglutamase [Gemmatimonadota bacterium]